MVILHSTSTYAYAICIVLSDSHVKEFRITAILYSTSYHCFSDISDLRDLRSQISDHTEGDDGTAPLSTPPT